MNESQKIQIRISELHKLIMDFPEDGAPEDMAKLRAELSDMEGKLQIALTKEGVKLNAEGEVPPEQAEDEKPEDKASLASAMSSEEREFNALYHRSRLTRYIDSIVNDREFEGAEKEFRAAVFGDAQIPEPDKQIPIHMMLPMDEEMIVRADVATTIAAGTGVVTTRDIMERVFARTDASFMGARFLSVGAGRQRFPYISSGASLVYANEGEPQDSVAGTITTEEVDPSLASLAYVIGKQSRLQYADGALENALRNDARQAIESGVDDTALNGRPRETAVQPFFAPGIDGLSGSLADDSGATSNFTALSLLREYASRVDGVYANQWTDVRMLVRPEVYSAGIFLAIGNNGDRLAADFLTPDRFRASSRLPAPDNNRRSQAISYSPVNDRGEFLIPSWQNVMVIFDPYTRANAQQDRLTFSIAHSVLVLRNDPWRKHHLQHPA